MTPLIKHERAVHLHNLVSHFLFPFIETNSQYKNCICYLKGSSDAHFPQVDMILGLNEKFVT